MDVNYDSLPIHAPLAKLSSNSDIMSPVVPPQQLPISHSSHPSSSNEPQLSQAQVTSMRRKKNADAQAAFRARRATYIASLEETGTENHPSFSLTSLPIRSNSPILSKVISLEAVVISLQDSCRESRNDADDLRRETNHLRSVVDALQKESRDRERQWRDFWVAKLQALGLDDPNHLNDFPTRPSPLNPDSTHSTAYHNNNNLRPSSFIDSDPLRFPTNSTDTAFFRCLLQMIINI